MDASITKKTQDSLGKIIKKPPLTEKLLGKPPFRFLHDIMTSVVKTTGFMQGLFTDNEMNSENVKDKDSKIAFLQKVVDMVAAVMGKSLNVRPVKIVAGHEPEKTNELLQVLADAINKNVDNDEYVRRVLKGDSGGGGKAGKEEKKERSSKDRTKSADRRKSDADGKGDREKEEEKGREKGGREKPSDRGKSRGGDRERTKDSDHGDSKGRDRSRDKRDDRHRDRSRKSFPPDPEPKLQQHDSTGPSSNKKSSSKVKQSDGLSGSNAKKSTVKSSSVHDKLTGASNSAGGVNSPKQKHSSSSSKVGQTAAVRRLGSIPARGSNSSPQPLSGGADQHSKFAGVGNNRGKMTSSKGQTAAAVVAGSHKVEEHLGSCERAKGDGHVSVGGGNEVAGGGGGGKSCVPLDRDGLKKNEDDDDDEGIEKEEEEGDKEVVEEDKQIGEDSDDRDESKEKENESPSRQNGEKEDKNEAPPRLQRPSSAKGSRRRREEDEEFHKEMAPSKEAVIGEGDLPPQISAARLARPSSARPAPPRPKQEATESEPAMRLGGGQPANVIVDNGVDDDEDDDDNFLVEESAPPPPELDQQPITKTTEEDDAEHGALVKKMLESKKELEGGSQTQQANQTKKTEIERPMMSDAQRRKQREQVQKEVEKLRGSIQSLTRSANPLGKVMDYVQEDLDSMQQELDKWKQENNQLSLDLKREMNVTDRAVEPLKQQLTELERAIGDQLDQIAATKSQIIRNDAKMGKMLKAIATS